MFRKFGCTSIYHVHCSNIQVHSQRHISGSGLRGRFRVLVRGLCQRERAPSQVYDPKYNSGFRKPEANPRGSFQSITQTLAVHDCPYLESILELERRVSDEFIPRRTFSLAFNSFNQFNSIFIGIKIQIIFFIMTRVRLPIYLPVLTFLSAMLYDSNNRKLE